MLDQQLPLLPPQNPKSGPEIAEPEPAMTHPPLPFLEKPEDRYILETMTPPKIEPPRKPGMSIVALTTFVKPAAAPVTSTPPELRSGKSVGSPAASCPLLLPLPVNRDPHPPLPPPNRSIREAAPVPSRQAQVSVY